MLLVDKIVNHGSKMKNPWKFKNGNMVYIAAQCIFCQKIPRTGCLSDEGLCSVCINNAAREELEKPIVITISWKHFPSNDQKVYRFDTNAEADAFLHGINEAIEWLSYTVINRQDGSIE